jgi:hypothetical protein
VVERVWRAEQCRALMLLFLRHRLLWRHRLQNRVGCEPGRGSRALRLRTHRLGLRLVAAERKRHGELATGLDRELTGRATALAQRGFRPRSPADAAGCGRRRGLVVMRCSNFALWGVKAINKLVVPRLQELRSVRLRFLPAGGIKLGGQLSAE